LTRRSFLKGSAYGAAGAVFSAAYADYSVHHPRLEEIELKLKGWRADGLRVGFITDIHVNEEDEMVRCRHAAELLAAAKPDLLLFGGDCINTSTAGELRNIAPSLEPFSALTCPKLAVLGNHDYWCGAIGRVEKTITESGFLVLKNDVVHFGKYAVAGYDDRIGGDRNPAFQPREESLLSLMHEPDDVDYVPEGACLQLSGHSHGGQICFPFGVPLHTPKLSRKYRRGFFPDAKVPLYVSRGVGTTGFKWRLFCPPEVTVLTLRSA
jgi:predicted MPP superfamily phosphohydrolase